MKYLITGGLGFLGSNLALEAIKNGEEPYLFDNLIRNGCYENHKWLKSKGAFEFIYGDIRNNNDVENVVKEIKPNVIFHVAGQVAMTTSLKNPKLDFEVNTLGTFNILDAIRKFSPDSCIIYSSTNKVYGDLEYLEYLEKNTRYIPKDYPNGFNEDLKLEFISPYGCSKGSADQYVLDYARMFKLKTLVFRHSSIYGSRQFATYDQGWVGWFCQKAVETKKGYLKDPFTISGNGKQVRDLLHVKDAVNLYYMASENIEKVKSQVFNIGGGIKNSLSILELFELLERNLNIKLKYKKIEPRKNDQKFFVVNIEKAEKLIGWKPSISMEKGLLEVVKWIEETIDQTPD